MRPVPGLDNYLSTPEIQRDLDEALQQLNEQDVTLVEVGPELVLLDHLNMSRPGTKTDKRYLKQKKLMKMMSSDVEKTQSLFSFFLGEAHNEIFYYPNRDEFEPDESRIKSKDLERGMEYELKQRTLNQWNVSNGRYKRFQVLITVLENLRKRQDGALILPVEQMAQCFEMSQYVMDDELKFRARYLSGSLIYKLKTVEFDCVNESQFIEALMYYGDNYQAQILLAKRAEKLDQRWWYELMAMNFIDMRNFTEAEKVVRLIQDSYGSSMDERVYLQFINAYLLATNIERVQHWTSKFKGFVKAHGFATEQRAEPGLGASEEATLQYLNRIDSPTKESYLNVIASHLGVDRFGEMQDLKNTVVGLIDFYLEQDNTSAEDLRHVLLDFRFQFATKIQPLLRGLSDAKAEEKITTMFEEYRTENLAESQQADTLDLFFQSLSEIGGFQRIISEMKKLTDVQQRLTPKNMYRLISALVHGGQLEKAYVVLTNLEQSYGDAIGNPDLMEQQVIPPVTAHHYIPFIRHFGRTGDVKSMMDVVERFESNMGQYNPLILTQILSSLDRNKQFEQALDYIHAVVLGDIHRQDPQYDDFRQLYSAIWKCLRHACAPGGVRENLPDQRVLFMKMIRDRVVPSPNDYSTIIKTFTLSRDWHAVVCVLQYMGLVHMCMPTPQCLKLIEKVYADQTILIDEVKRSPLYSEAIQRLQDESVAQKTLDPFASGQKSMMMDGDMQPERPSLEHQLLWRIALAKMVDMIKVRSFKDGMMEEAHREFGLEMRLDELMGPLEL